jgi:Concanavalin A-like lectin/glucanases superfamily
MAKKPVPLAEWRPDIALLDTQFASEVENVFAGVNSYLPFPGLEAFSPSSLTQAGNDSFTKVLLHLSSNLTDSNIGGSAHTWTAAGNAVVNAGSYVFGGGSLLLDGTGDWISTPDHADFTLGTSDFTIDSLFLCDAPGGTIRYIGGQGDAAGTTASASFALFRMSDNRLRASVVAGSTSYTCLGTTQFTNTLNPGWHHIAFVRKDTTLRMFVDGVQEGSDITISAAVNNSSNALRIGARGEFTSDTWMGRIQEFRVTVGKARWWTTFSPQKMAYFDGGGRVCGLYAARTTAGTWKVFGGTTTKLLTWTLAGWSDVSRVSGVAYNVAPDDLWKFETFGDKVIAVNINDDPQVINVDSGTNFAPLGGSPPRATNVKTIGDFLFLSGLSQSASFNNRQIIWSSINDIGAWVPGVNLCDVQEFPDGGPVTGVDGGEIGYVLQQGAIRTLQFLPGDTTFIFNFSRVLHERGCISKYGFTCIGNTLYFLSEDGFYAVSGQQVSAIGADKVNDWFRANSDINRRNVVQAFSFIDKPRLAWAFHYSSGSTLYEKLIIYDWSNQRFAKATERAQVWAAIASLDLDLDTTGTELNDDLLDSAAHSLDSFAYLGGRPLIGAINADGYLAALSGPPLAATMETAEAHLVPGMRAFVSEVYPLDDAASDAPGYIAAGTRERLQGGAPFWSEPVPIELTGSAAAYSSARLHRFRRYIPAASAWTHATGIIVDAQQDGTVA